MDRLARSLIDLQQLVDEILTKGASVYFIKEGQTYSAAGDDSMGRLMLQILGAFAQFERNLIRERQAKGIRIAKTAGKYNSRAKLLNPDQLAQARELVNQGVPKTRIAAQLSVNRSTLYRALAQGRAASARGPCVGELPQTYAPCYSAQPRSADVPSLVTVSAFRMAVERRCWVRAWRIRRCARLFHWGFLVVPAGAGGQLAARAGGPSAAV